MADDTEVQPVKIRSYLAINRTVYRHAKARAALQGLTLNAYVEQALVQKARLEDGAAAAPERGLEVPFEAAVATTATD